MDTVRFNVAGHNYDIPLIKDAKEYTIVNNKTCNCSIDVRSEYYWHLDGIYNNPINNKLYLCVTCKKCLLKYMTIFNFDDLIFYLNMLNDEYKARN